MRSVRRSAIAPDLGGRDRQEVAGQRHRGPVEVPARLHAAVGQDHRVVDGRAQLGGGDGLHVSPRVARGPVHLRSAAHRVGVLHARIVVAVARHDLGPGEQPREIGGTARLAGLGAHGHEVGGEGAVRAEQRLRRHGRRDVRHLEQPLQVVEGQQQHPEDAVRAVDQSEALLGGQRERLDRRRGEPLRRRDALAGGRPDLALAHQRQAAVSERERDRRSHRASRARGPPGRAPPPAERAWCRRRSGAPPSGPSPGSGRGGTSSRAPPHVRSAGPCPPRASGSGHAEAPRAAPAGSRCRPASRSRSTRRRPARPSRRAARPRPRSRPWRRAPRPTVAPPLHGGRRRRRRPARPGRRSARLSPSASRPFDHIAAGRPREERSGEASPGFPSRRSRARGPSSALDCQAKSRSQRGFASWLGEAMGTS